MRGHRYAGPVNLLKHMRAFHGDNPKALTKSKELEVHQLLSKSGIQFDYQDYQHHLPFRSCGLGVGDFRRLRPLRRLGRNHPRGGREPALPPGPQLRRAP